MTITFTLEEILDNCSDWDFFCKEEGWSEWAVNEGSGNVSVCLTEEQCYKYGLLKDD